MLTLASQNFANGAWTFAPEEPATLPLLLVGLGTLVVYGMLSGWRMRRPAIAVTVKKKQSGQRANHSHRNGGGHRSGRRAA